MNASHAHSEPHSTLQLKPVTNALKTVSYSMENVSVELDMGITVSEDASVAANSPTHSCIKENAQNVQENSLMSEINADVPMDRPKLATLAKTLANQMRLLTQTEPATHAQSTNSCKMEDVSAKMGILETDAVVNLNATIINLFTEGSVPLVRLTLFIENKSTAAAALSDIT